MYVGWIPNVSGYLSYSHIGGMPIRNKTFRESLYPPTKFLNHSEEPTYISLLQERNLSDRPTLGPITRSTARGRFTFLLQAELHWAGAVRTLKGFVFCIPMQHSSELDALHKRAQQGANPGNFASETAHVLADLGARFPEAFFAMRFDLHDDGIIELHTAFNKSTDARNQRVMPFEAYSFVKDVLHRHKFHSASDDALLELAPCALQDGRTWSNLVARNLHRSVISSFRSASPSSHVDGLGQLSYLESFLRILEKRQIKDVPDFSFDSLRSALEAHQNRAALERDELSTITTFALSMLAIALPILFVCLQLLQIPCIEGLNKTADCTAASFSIPPKIIDVAAIVLRKLDWLIVGLIVVVACVLLYLGRHRFLSLGSSKINLSSWISDVRDLLLRVAISNRWITLAILSGVGALIAFGSLYSLKELLKLPDLLTMLKAALTS